MTPYTIEEEPDSTSGNQLSMKLHYVTPSSGTDGRHIKMHHHHIHENVGGTTGGVISSGEDDNDDD
jgi:hypothetical protein